MARRLSIAAILAKNKVASDIAWLILLEIQLKNDPDPIYIVRNTEQVEWNGQIWLPYAFNLTEAREDNKGSLPEIQVNIDNTSRDIEYYLQAGGGGTGARVILRAIPTNALGTPTADYEEYYAVTKTTVTEQAIQFTLGNAYPNQSRRPWRRMLKNACPFKYKGIECKCTSKELFCNHTLTDCRARGNSTRFGGFPGIPQGGLYV